MTQDAREIFEAVIERVKVLDPVNSRSWFNSLALKNFNGGMLEILCPDSQSASFLQDTCVGSFTLAAQQITGHLVTIRFLSDGKIPKGKAAKQTTAEPKLHPDYTFDNFVVGPCNRLAHASCIAVSKSLGTTYNPLFIYGTVGLGKTHLLHAVCRETQSSNPKAKILFLSCEEFVNRFINAIEQGSMAEFKSQYRTVDLLVIDDVQFLQERDQSQEEFFHTFNALYDNRSQIVLSADAAPGEIPSLPERLTSRFKCGLVARIDAPSYETRIAIVQKKARLRGMKVSDDAAEYIAGRVKANIREIEGALTTLYALAGTTGEEISKELAKIALGDDETADKNISITDIIKAVTSYYEVRPADLQSKKRSQSITMPRQICMYLARNLTSHSLEEIGGHLGGRDHTTVMHACGKIAGLQQSNERIQSQLTELTKRITK
ncbi:MAG: chromosomal replication initiator protein DnaA [Planctomycetes bacterium]|nr:chromosomal replication initiator protein DnaA [Planctomycetota bacterium]MBU1517803.1 chromosomal replication initiator protein DnaA [Planctomycetota bacterium]MBU2457283.1 chromosomal replication initiator protein DnaA [Planctomycetota bacterium]MBU2596837.1 chromosomal replication initiator protein DnaA [Planctomycetota bacterium]